MRENRLVWLAVGLAVVALVNSAIVGYFGLHSHDDFLKIGANDTITKMPWYDDGTIEWIPDGGTIEWVPENPDADETGSGFIQWNDTTYSETVPFEQGMTLYPGQSATNTIALDINDLFSEVEIEMTEEEKYAFLLELMGIDTTK